MRNGDSSAGVLPIADTDNVRSASHARVGTITALNDDGTVEIQLDGEPETLTARLAVTTSRERLELAVAERQQAVALFEHGDRTRAIVVGFIEALLPEPAPVQPASPQMVEADVDGRRVRVTAVDEIVLQCGSASITLRRNGRVIVRGTYIETHSEGTNRIKGGQVLLN